MFLWGYVPGLLRSAVSLIVTAICVGAVAQPATAENVRVPEDYYGVAYPHIAEHARKSPAILNAQLAAIADAGITQIRITIPWSELEPTAPSPQHAYSFAFPDLLFKVAAREGLRVEPTFAFTPRWAEVESSQASYCRSLGVVSLAPKIAYLDDYAAAAGVLASRYGPHGTFWSENPTLPYRPVASWEIWNEPSLKGYWCPNSDPERYATLFVLAAQQINGVDPLAEIVTGGLPLESPSGNFLDVQQFFRRALAERPDLLRWADSIGIHVYPGKAPERSTLSTLGRFRNKLRAAGVPDVMPMAATEIGWSTGGEDPFTENQRAAAYWAATHQIPRTRCNVSAMVAHAWNTHETNPPAEKKQAWYGIADPRTAAYYASARKFGLGIAWMRGRLDAEPPFGLPGGCEEMAPVDRDASGVPDHLDYYPLDPARSKGPAAPWVYAGEDRP